MTESITDSMKWASALSTRPSLEAAVAEVVQKTKDSLNKTPDLGFVFISSAFASEYSRLMPLLQEQLPKLPIVGCGGSGVIGMDRYEQAEEVEGGASSGVDSSILTRRQCSCFPSRC